MNTADTHLVEYVPYPMRNERCAVGVLARRHDGNFSMHLGHQLKKAKALNPACNIEALRDGLEAVAAELQHTPRRSASTHQVPQALSFRHARGASPTVTRLNLKMASPGRCQWQWSLPSLCVHASAHPFLDYSWKLRTHLMHSAGWPKWAKASRPE